ncbi:MAG TPA: UpxY family transcription antiterminator [Terriglobia bacterium]|nr:UpxY family transcription antiterminator [Terriglobia bacterium]
MAALSQPEAPSCSEYTWRDQNHASLLPEWYAVYTRSHQERVVKTQLDGRGVENFLPTYEKTSQWKDRKKLIQMPLFPGYLFVKILSVRRLEVLKAYGVVQIVGNSTGPMPIPEDQVASVRTFVEVGLKCDPHPYLKIGKKVRITEGPLEGLQGILVRKKNRSLFVISVEMIQRSVSVELEGWKISAS